MRLIVLALLAMPLSSGVAAAQQIDVAALAAPLRAVGPEGQGHAAATAAWQRLSKADAEQLPAVLAAMDGAGPLARNWLRAAVDTIASRTLEEDGALPTAELERFLGDRRHSPHARATAYEWIRRVDPAAEARLIPGMLDDPSMELRFDAVRLAAAEGDKLLEAGNRQAALAAYKRAFAASRQLDQVRRVADKLEQLDQRPDLAAHFGFIRSWRLVGPFDNREMAGFDVPYGPEADPLRPSYMGVEGPLKWIEHTTSDPLGMVDLNEALGRHKGAICYAYAEFVSPRERPCELRIGCVNANKAWLNGQLLTSNHVYHSGRLMDQYTGSGRLREGRNQILVKIAQNEQTDQWAQDWEFQLRVCDALGTGLLSE